MPIYAYKCSACGHAQDVLQKMSDPLLTDCPECGQSAYVKQVTAAGFQLKGSGWYVTDFRDGGKKPDASSPGEASSSPPSSSPADAATAAKPAGTSPPSSSAPSSTPTPSSASTAAST